MRLCISNTLSDYAEAAYEEQGFRGSQSLPMKPGALNTSGALVSLPL